MGELVAFRLNFSSPLHLGSTRSDYDTSETIQHSDTLYAAITQAWCSLGLEAKLNVLLMENGAFKGVTLSSLYPYYKKEEGYLYFFPIPLDTVGPAVSDTALRKKIKKTQFVDAANFRRIQAAGELNVNTDAIKGSFITLDEEFDQRFLSRQVFPRARVPRSGITKDTEIYYIERLFFKKGSGLYVLALVEEESQICHLQAMLEFLGEEGIGTDRHVGHGLFTVERVAEMGWAPELELQANYRTNLSLFLPEDRTQLQSFLDKAARYKMIKRGGWITTASYLTYRKNSVHMFQEGGLFRCGLVYAGATVNLQPQQLPMGHQVNSPVYRSGKSLFVPVNLNA